MLLIDQRIRVRAPRLAQALRVIVCALLVFLPVRAQEPTATSPRLEAITRKLNSIVFPHLDFREATLRESIDYLKKKSAEFDETTELKDVHCSTILRDNINDRRVTYSAKQVTLLAALAGVAEAAKVDAYLTVNHIYFVPKGEAFVPDKSDVGEVSQKLTVKK